MHPDRREQDGQKLRADSAGASPRTPAAFGQAVVDAFALDLQLHLRQRGHHGEDHAAHGRAGVDVPTAQVQHTEMDPSPPQFFGEPKHVDSGPAQPVQSGDHARVTLLQGLEGLVEAGPAGPRTADSLSKYRSALPGPCNTNPGNQELKRYRHRAGRRTDSRVRRAAALLPGKRWLPGRQGLYFRGRSRRNLSLPACQPAQETEERAPAGPKSNNREKTGTTTVKELLSASATNRLQNRTEAPGLRQYNKMQGCVWLPATGEPVNGICHPFEDQGHRNPVLPSLGSSGFGAVSL
jgi:hypothetical protein